MKGSKDFSVLLFTCLCRALDVPARLVFSLQPVDWRAPSTVAGAPRKKKGETAAGEEEAEAEAATPKRNAVAGSSKDVSSRNASGDEAARDYRPKLKSTARKRAKVVDPTRSPSPGQSISSQTSLMLSKGARRQIRTKRNDRPYSGPKFILDLIASGSSSMSYGRRCDVARPWNRIELASRINCDTSSDTKKVSRSVPSIFARLIKRVRWQIIRSRTLRDDMLRSTAPSLRKLEFRRNSVQIGSPSYSFLSRDLSSSSVSFLRIYWTPTDGSMSRTEIMRRMSNWRNTD